MMKQCSSIILKRRQLQKGVTVKVVIAVVSQQCGIVVENLLCPLS